MNSYTPADEDIQAMRLQRFLARAGVASRRRCDDMVAAGRVSINGTRAQVGQKVLPGKDVVTVDGRVIEPQSEQVTLMLNKPTQVLSSMARQKSERIVADFLPLERYPGLYPLGRLDSDTTGLLLFSTDGQLGHALLHPSHHVSKTYEVTLTRPLTHAQVEQLRCGIQSDDFTAQPAQLRLFPKRNNFVELTIHEGQYHQVKRMFETLGHKVVKLHRTKFANLELGNLAVGKWRLLDDGELTKLTTFAARK